MKENTICIEGAFQEQSSTFSELSALPDHGLRCDLNLKSLAHKFISQSIRSPRRAQYDDGQSVQEVHQSPIPYHAPEFRIRGEFRSKVLVGGEKTRHLPPAAQ